MTSFLPNPSDLRWLVWCLKLGSFSAAAREQNVAVSIATRAVDRLEAGYGVRLLRRSTHGLSATPEGSDLWREAQELLNRLDDVSSLLTRQTQRVAGTVRLATSTAICESLLLPHLGRLTELHPSLRVELVADDRVVDLVNDGIDVALRSAVGSSESVVARELGSFERRLYASPRYLAAHGTPADPYELQRHVAVTHTARSQSSTWPFRVAGEVVDVQVGSGLAVNNTSLLHQALLQGLGIGMVSVPLVAAAVSREELVEVLPQFASGITYGMYAVSLPGRHNAARVRVVIDFLDQLARDTWVLDRKAAG